MAVGLPGLKPTRVEDPGPGTYNAPSSLFQQSLSHKPTAPRARLGTADRDGSRRVFLSKGHEREAIGKHSPGPQVYNPSVTAVGGGSCRAARCGSGSQ